MTWAGLAFCTWRKNANVVGTNFVQEHEQTLKGPFFTLPMTPPSLIARINAETLILKCSQERVYSFYSFPWQERHLIKQFLMFAHLQTWVIKL